MTKKKLNENKPDQQHILKNINLITINMNQT